jgi:hypothetical protein
VPMPGSRGPVGAFETPAAAGCWRQSMIGAPSAT